MSDDKIGRSEDEWRHELTPEQYRILREKGTERAFSGRYHDCKDAGTYTCAACGSPLFSSTSKFDSGTGWPSFSEPVNPQAVATDNDRSFGMQRVEVLCGRCDSHLGHVFPDGPGPVGLRYCVNSASLQLDPDTK